MSIQRDALIRSICARVNDERRTLDELRVMDDVLLGIEQGAEVIGPLDLVSDARDFELEAAEECRDLICYLAMKKVARAHQKRERIESDELHGLRHLDFDVSDEGGEQ